MKKVKIIKAKTFYDSMNLTDMTYNRDIDIQISAFFSNTHVKFVQAVKNVDGVLVIYEETIIIKRKKKVWKQTKLSNV